MSRAYLGALTLASCLVLGIGVLVRGRLLRADTPPPAAPPSEASPLQQLGEEAQLRRMSGALDARVAAVAAFVEYVPGTAAAGVRWRGDTIVSTQADRPVVAVLRAGARDSSRRRPVIAADSARSDWVLVVARRSDGRVISTAGLGGGRVRARCGTAEIEEFLLSVPLHERFAGAGLFDLDGRTLGTVVRCADRLVAVPAREVSRLMTDSGSSLDHVRRVYGLMLAPLDTRAKTYFGIDSGLLVTEVRRGGPADAAGLRPGDLVMAVEGRPLVSAADVGAFAAEGSTVGQTVRRRRGTSETTVRLSSANAGSASAANAGFGIDIAGPADQRGAPITAVRRESAAYAAGVRAGDRLLRVGDATITTRARAQRLLDAKRDGPTFVVFERDSVERGVLLDR